MSREITVSRALGLRGACGARGGRPPRPPEPYACTRVNVTEKGIDTFRVFGTRRRVRTPAGERRSAAPDYRSLRG